jgi:hypothetical protein
MQWRPRQLCEYMRREFVSSQGSEPCKHRRTICERLVVWHLPGNRPHCATHPVRLDHSCAAGAGECPQQAFAQLQARARGASTRGPSSRSLLQGSPSRDANKAAARNGLVRHLRPSALLQQKSRPHLPSCTKSLPLTTQCPLQIAWLSLKDSSSMLRLRPLCVSAMQCGTTCSDRKHARGA